jgi:proteasome assembly chaperone 4
MPVSGTTLLRTSKDALALPLSQRLGMYPASTIASITDNSPAQRFKKQIFVSIDLNPGHITGGKGPTVALAVEKAIMRVLVALEKGT